METIAALLKTVGGVTLAARHLYAMRVVGLTSDFVMPQRPYTGESFAGVTTPVELVHAGTTALNVARVAMDGLFALVDPKSPQ